MTALSSIQKSAMSQALTVAKAALRGHGAAEAGVSQAGRVVTASAKTAKARNAGVTLAKSRTRKARIRV